MTKQKVDSVVTGVRGSLEELHVQQITASLFRKGSRFVWIRSDGTRVSPYFPTEQAARYMLGRIPMLSDKEWRQREGVSTKA